MIGIVETIRYTMALNGTITPPEEKPKIYQGSNNSVRIEVDGSPNYDGISNDMYISFMREQGSKLLTQKMNWDGSVFYWDLTISETLYSGILRIAFKVTDKDEIITIVSSNNDDLNLLPSNTRVLLDVPGLELGKIYTGLNTTTANTNVNNNNNTISVDVINTPKFNGKTQDELFGLYVSIYDRPEDITLNEYGITREDGILYERLPDRYSIFLSTNGLSQDGTQEVQFTDGTNTYKAIWQQDVSGGNYFIKVTNLAEDILYYEKAIFISGFDEAEIRIVDGVEPKFFIKQSTESVGIEKTADTSQIIVFNTASASPIGLLPEAWFDFAQNYSEESVKILNLDIPAVIDNLISTSTNNALSANQGRELKALIDGLDAKTDEDVEKTAITTNFNGANVKEALEGIDTVLSNKYDKTGGIISGDVTITGNLTTEGTTTFVNTTEMEVKDPVIIQNKGETSAGVSTGFAGTLVDRGTQTDFEYGFNEINDRFEAGFIGDRKILTIKSETDALSDRVTINENDIDNLELLKEDIANKTNDIQSNINSSTKYPSTKGVNDFIIPRDNKIVELQRYNQTVQVSGQPKFYRISNDTTLYDGRIETWQVPRPLDLVPGNIQFSLAGSGGTFLDVIDQPGNNASLTIPFGTIAEYVDMKYIQSLNKWQIQITDSDINDLAGNNWDGSKTVSFNYDKNTVQDNRLDNLELAASQAGELILRKIGISAPITVLAGENKITLDDTLKESNDLTVINFDVNNDSILLDDNEAGYFALGNFEIRNDGGVNSTAKVEFKLYYNDDLATPIDTFVIEARNGTILNQTSDRSKSVTFTPLTVPKTLVVYYELLDGSATITKGTLDVQSQFTISQPLSPSSTEITTLSSPSTETPAGNKTNQKEANEEFTGLLNERLSEIPFTLTSGGWSGNSQIVTATGLKIGDTFIVGYDTSGTSWSDAGTNQVRALDITVDDQVTFKNTTDPTSNIVGILKKVV